MARVDAWRVGCTSLGSASPAFLSPDALVICECEEGISGLFSPGPETPDGLERHRPARASFAVGAGTDSDAGPPASTTLSVVSTLTNLFSLAL